MDNDPYYYIAYAQEMVERGTFRIRYTDRDNVPFGREMHWDSGSMWLIIFCGFFVQIFTGLPMHSAIEVGALFSNPLLFVVTLIVAGWAILRRFGGLASAGFLILLPALSALTWDYGYARPGHHGLHTTASLGLLLCLFLGGVGWVRRRLLPDGNDLFRYWPDLQQAKIFFIASGCFGGMALWIGATEQLFIIAGAGLGLLGSIFLAARGIGSGEAFSLEPALFRLWGRSASLTALIFYTIEYLPDHIGMRLEVNHPVYIVAWLAGGELLFQIAHWRTSGELPVGLNRWFLLLALLGTLLPPVLLLFGPKEWHSLHDPYMRRQHEFINMFEPFSHSVADRGWMVLLMRFGLLPLWLIFTPLLLVLLRRRLPVVSRAGLIFLLPASIITFAMLWVQVRWSGLLSLTLALLAFGSAAMIWPLIAARKLWIRVGAVVLFALLALAPNLAAFGLGFHDSLLRARSGILDPILAWTIAARDVAFNLKRIAARESVRVMSGPGPTPALHFFGGVHGTSALYWENIDGVRDAASFFSDPGDERARQIARERGITHVVIEQSPQEAIESCVIFYGKRDDAQIKTSLAYRLADPLGKIPEWLEPLPYYGSPMAANFQMRIYRVLPGKLPPR